MANLRRQLDEATVSLFATSVQITSNVTESAKAIGQLNASIGELGPMFGTLQNFASPSTLASVTDEWNDVHMNINDLVTSRSNSTPTSSCGDQATWSRILLISNKLQRLVIKIRRNIPDGRYPRQTSEINDLQNLLEIDDRIRFLEGELRDMSLQTNYSQQGTTPTARRPQPCANCVQRRQELYEANSLIEEFQVEKAGRLEVASSYTDAIEIYRTLIAKKDLEIQRECSNGEEADMNHVESHALKYKSNLARLLVKQSAWSQAEQLARPTWERSKIVNGPQHEITRGSLRQLCLSLREQGTPEKLREAKHLYYGVWTDPSSHNALVARDAWVIENGLGLGKVLEMENSNQKAQQHYEDLWEVSTTAALRLATLVSRRGDLSRFKPVLRKCLTASDEAVKREAASLAYEAGRALYSQKKYADAKDILAEILREETLTAETSPTKLQGRNLQAWTCRYAGDLVQAELHAKYVWDHSSAWDSLHSSGYAGGPGGNYIYILAKQQKPWQVVWTGLLRLQNASEATRSPESRRKTARAWLTLSDDVDAAAGAHTGTSMPFVTKWTGNTLAQLQTGVQIRCAASQLELRCIGDAISPIPPRNRALFTPQQPGFGNIRRSG